MSKKLETFQHELAEIQSHGIPAPIKKTELDLTGDYSVKNKTLIRNDGMELFLGERKKPTSSKPVNFLLLVDSNGKKSYCSSMFPNPKSRGTFNMDYDNKKYLLSFSDTEPKATIWRRCSTKMAVNQ